MVLARGAMGRAEASSGAAVRDADGRTYAGAPVKLRALELTALQAARRRCGVQRCDRSGGRGVGWRPHR